MSAISNTSYRAKVTIYCELLESRKVRDYMDLNGWKQTGGRVDDEIYYNNHNYASWRTYEKDFTDISVMDKEVEEVHILFEEKEEINRRLRM